MIAVVTAAAKALQHGHAFIQQLAEKVRVERETESVEEFFEGIDSALIGLAFRPKIVRILLQRAGTFA